MRVRKEEGRDGRKEDCRRVGEEWIAGRRKQRRINVRMERKKEEEVAGSREGSGGRSKERGIKERKGLQVEGSREELM